MKRDIINKLVEWKDNSRRKPLLLTGVRQCGKTHTLKEFGNKYFKNVCYINFEADSKYASVFDYDFDIERILREISLIQQCKITEGETLLIFDEIQEAPRALTALKYFCENKRGLHIACAGSLLGVAIKHQNISFPVGKVNRMQMYPLSFREFVSALGYDSYLEMFSDWSVDREIPPSYANELEHLLKEYYIIGGMPEAVKEYVETRNFETVAEIQDEILADYADDFSKHAPISEHDKIRMIWDSVPKQLAKENNKFVFSHVKEGKRAHELESALLWLKYAGLVHTVELVQNADTPLSAYADATNSPAQLSPLK
ncbi:MAG: ATP-binding protein [Bacteroidales bacterium]|nr:ATP-binding protein [Bacteroidales bacterium]